MTEDEKKRATRVGAMVLATSMMFSAGCAKALADSDKEENDKVIEYTIQRGDTLRGISRDFYNGDPQYYDELALYNDIINPNLIRRGETLNVPEDPAYLVSEVRDSSTKEQTYVIKKGDTLSEISKAYYGTSKYAWAIATVNHLADPNLIVTGNTLVIPSTEDIKKVKVIDYVDTEPHHHHDHHHDGGWVRKLFPKK